jgi:hypothetical protein
MATALNRARRQRRLNDLLATGAGHAGSHDPVHDKPARNVFQLFGHILGDGAKRAITCARFARRQRLLTSIQNGGGGDLPIDASSAQSPTFGTSPSSQAGRRRTSIPMDPPADLKRL